MKKVKPNRSVRTYCLPQIKLIRIIITLIFIISFFKIHANTYPQNKKISLKIENAIEQENFKETKTRLNFQILDSNEKVNLNQKVTLPANR